MRMSDYLLEVEISQTGLATAKAPAITSPAPAITSPAEECQSPSYFEKYQLHHPTFQVLSQREIQSSPLATRSIGVVGGEGNDTL